MYQGDYESTQQHCYQAYLISREIGDRNGEGIALSNLGILALHKDDYPTAYQHLEQSLKISRDIGDRFGEGMALTQLGNLALDAGNIHQAEDCYQEALTIHEELNQSQYVPDDQAGLAAVSLAHGDLSLAQQRLGPVLAYLAENPTLSGAWQPYRIFGVCFQVLRAADDAQAWYILEQAHTLLQNQAATMDDDYQKTFLENVTEHRYIVTTWQQYQAQATHL
ncbi:MAG: tetratricopeptide repeat protein [Okeania sp. SIO3B3]|nr:tetratricopeptide repeat protein [Okeania sp. SIO3B3]